MKSILLIGMGKFGQTLGTRLLNMGDEVMIVDKNEDIINALAPKYTNALIANCMNADNLSTMDIPSFDVCVVAIGDDFQSSLEITSLLKDLGAKYVAVIGGNELESGAMNVKRMATSESETVTFENAVEYFRGK